MRKFGSSDPLPTQKCRYRISNGSCQLANGVVRTICALHFVHKRCGQERKNKHKHKYINA